MALLLPSFASAQQLPGAGSFPDGPGVEGHGWLVIGPPDAPKIVHVPPRGTVDVGSGRLMSGDGGTVRLAARLNSLPEAVAASGRMVYLIFPPGPGERRLVLRASVSPAPVGNLWDIDQHERLDAMPSLEATGRLAGFAATEVGLMALVAEGRPEHAKLFVLTREKWVPLNLPPASGSMQLLAVPGEIGLLAQGDGASTLWQGKPSEPTSARPVSIEWTSTPMPWLDLDDDARRPALSWIAGALVWGVWTRDGLELREARPTGVHTLALVPGVASRFAMAALPQSGRIIVVWTRPKAGALPPAAGLPPEEPAYEVREVSVHTGRVLYDGAPAEAWPFSLVEFRLLALLLLAIVVGVLLFVLRPDVGDGAILLPRSTALAEPWRRALAGGIDLAVAWLVVSTAMGVTLESLMFPVFGARLVPVVLLVLGAACAHCTLGEWLVGRSIGKAVAGCRVAVVGVSADAAAGDGPPMAPSFRAALVRNLFRWGVPPLGLAALGSPDGRHRGDILARTAVVVPIDGEEQGPD